MKFRLLGPVEVFDGARWVGVGAAKVRLLLVTLLVRARQVVPIDLIVDELWGATPPKTAATQVHGYVLRLRRLLGDPDGRLLTTVAPGYRLEVADDDTDIQLFRAKADEGLQAERPGDAAELLAAALAHWRGPAFADVPASAAIAAEAGTARRATAHRTRRPRRRRPRVRSAHPARR